MTTIGPSGDYNTKEILSDSDFSEEEESVISASLNLNPSSADEVKLTQSISPTSSARSAPPDLITTTNNYEQISDQSGGDLTNQLPNTVTILSGNNGAKVYLIGTAHFSTQSQDDVRKTIALTQPNRVMLELCHSRRNILTLDEETILREAQDIGWKKLQETMLSGKSGIQGVLHLVLLSMSAQLTRKLGMAPGGEFRAAMQEARKIPNCIVILGDRPFNVTLSRALDSLTIIQKFKLAYQFLTSSDDITKEEIERCKERDLLEKMLLEMTGEFPSITQVFVSERDEYLAHSLYMATVPQFEENGEEKLPSEPITVVGVVGMGHVPGICAHFGNTQLNRIQSISRAPEKRKSMIGWTIRKTLKYGTFVLIGYGALKLLSRNEYLVSQSKTLGNFVIAKASTIRNKA